MPLRALASYVKCYWVLETEPGETPAAVIERVYPNGSAELVFHRRDPFELRDDDGRFCRQPRALLFGQIERRVVLRQPRRVQTVGVSFRAAGMASFFRVPAGDLTGRAGRLPDLAGRRAVRDLQARVLEAADPVAALRHVEAFLVERLRARRVPATVQSAVAAIGAGGGRVRVEDLCRAERVSARQLQRRFRESVGLSPKRYAAIVRFQNALRMIDAGRARLTDVAHSCGYYDQPHFIREFRGFTGVSPRRHLRHDGEMARFFAAS